jgi:hypothetical protein
VSFTYTALTNASDEGDYLRQSVEITPEALQEEFTRIPSDMAYWGERYAEATGEALRAYHGRKFAYAEALLQHKAACKLNGIKMTEAEVAAQAEVDPAYQTAVLREAEAEAAKVAAKTRFDAVVAKKDMVVSIGATQRAEMAPHQLRKHTDY